MARGVIKQIFTEQWEGFEANNKVRDVVSKETNKMLKCQDLSEGYSEYHCPTCGERKYVAFTCKSRFCTSCGKKATDDWVDSLCRELLDVPHRHMVFTIPEKLRIVFYPRFSYCWPAYISSYIFSCSLGIIHTILGVYIKSFFLFTVHFVN